MSGKPTFAKRYGGHARLELPNMAYFTVILSAVEG
jgi:hypothetical protein